MNKPKILSTVDPTSCPKCGSRNITSDTMDVKNDMIDFICKACGYAWQHKKVSQEVVGKVKEFQKLKKNNDEYFYKQLALSKKISNAFFDYCYLRDKIVRNWSDDGSIKSLSAYKIVSDIDKKNVKLFYLNEKKYWMNLSRINNIFKPLCQLNVRLIAIYEKKSILTGNIVSTRMYKPCIRYSLITWPSTVTSLLNSDDALSQIKTYKWSWANDNHYSIYAYQTSIPSRIGLNLIDSNNKALQTYIEADIVEINNLILK
ncbi:MAG: TFIIB-type zinc ribbon-containing protein [Mycoplasmataceae bacterium]|jgi:transcription elongation factor Elf1|nr:TFIIB-type zinc ribbon-containing protein [Mycoplasmataceae bacterium]